jgi:hypothetical protein
VFCCGKAEEQPTLEERGTRARTPNYDFDRRERERLKKQKAADRAEAKLKPAADETNETPETPDKAADEE